jgi:2-desacetyl-2-hydroxyethyl bacteriochlorophyllide A dehydrogenase
MLTNLQSLNIYFAAPHRVEIREEPVCEPGPGEVRVRTHKTLISTGTEGIVLTQNFESGTHWDRWVQYPFSPGYSLVGEVESVGTGVDNVRVGERVAARAPHRQYVLVNAERLYHIPEGVSEEDATWFGLANIAQNGVRRARHVLGDAVVVIGLGILGQLVVQYVRLMGARAVIAVDTARRRLEMAQAHGATATLALGAEEACREVLRLTEGAGAEVVYDVTGNAAVFPHALGMARRFGKLLLLGDTGMPSGQHLTSDVIVRGVQVIGAHDSQPPPASTDYSYWSHQKMAELFFLYLLRGEIRVSDLITHRYPPTKAPEAYQMLCKERAQAMGVLFDWTAL